MKTSEQQKTTTARPDLAQLTHAYKHCLVWSLILMFNGSLWMLAGEVLWFFSLPGFYFSVWIALCSLLGCGFMLFFGVAGFASANARIKAAAELAAENAKSDQVH